MFCMYSSLSFTDCQNDLDQFKTLKPGMMVAMYVEQHWPQICPQIAKVFEVNTEEETMKVHWFHSKWKGKCSPAFHGAGKHRTPNVELVDIRCCVLWDFTLTTKNKALKGNTSDNLKSIYSSLHLSV